MPPLFNDIVLRGSLYNELQNLVKFSYIRLLSSELVNYILTDPGFKQCYCTGCPVSGTIWRKLLIYGALNVGSLCRTSNLRNGYFACLFH